MGNFLCRFGAGELSRQTDGRTRLLARLAGAFLVLSVGAAMAQTAPSRADRAGGSKAVPLPKDPVAEAIRNEERDISALVLAGEETVLSSQMPGKIKSIGYGLGDTVAAGATLLEFDCSEQDAQLQTAEAEYRGARETHLAKLKLQALGAAGELEVTVAAAAADKAKSQVVVREAQMAYCKVQAPFGGRIAKMRVKVAESVAIGQPMIDMVNQAQLKVQVYVPATWVRWMQVGTPFVVRLEDGRSYRARVVKLNSRVEGVSQSLELEGRFDGPTQWLLPGMVGTAVFPSRSRQ